MKYWDHDTRENRRSVAQDMLVDINSLDRLRQGKHSVSYVSQYYVICHIYVIKNIIQLLRQSC
jgi:hypothetical protein